MLDRLGPAEPWVVKRFNRALRKQGPKLRQGILANMEGIKELLKYVGRTARFKTTLGDAIGDASHLEPEEG